LSVYVVQNNETTVTNYTYNLNNRLIRIDQPGLRAEYAYRVDGMRISKSVNIINPHCKR